MGGVSRRRHVATSTNDRRQKTPPTDFLTALLTVSVAPDSHSSRPTEQVAGSKHSVAPSRRRGMPGPCSRPQLEISACRDTSTQTVKTARCSTGLPIVATMTTVTAAVDVSIPMPNATQRPALSVLTAILDTQALGSRRLHAKTSPRGCRT